MYRDSVYRAKLCLTRRTCMDYTLPFLSCFSPTTEMDSRQENVFFCKILCQVITSPWDNQCSCALLSLQEGTVALLVDLRYLDLGA